MNQFNRANEQLAILAELSDSNLALKNTYQALISAEKSRQQIFSGTRAPVIFGQPAEWVSYYLQALLSFKRNNIPQAKKEIETGASLAPAIGGSINGKTFLWLADADVRLGPLLEIIINGNYYWLPFNRINKLVIDDFEDLRDLVWCPCHLTLENLGEIIAFIPSRYPPLFSPGLDSSQDPPVNDAASQAEYDLASKTSWQMPEENFYIGQGLRSFITDNDEYALSGVDTIVLDHSPK
ncbi:type VI secretion system accessory protein TagJ [Thalassomonas haliotis]|nr:type VI secretion system accessory protein TagJ [Thalassomonas haliotis]